MPNIESQASGHCNSIELGAARIETHRSHSLQGSTGPDEGVESILQRNLKLSSAAYSFFVAGTNDGSMGALLPYILDDYGIGTSLVTALYLTTFAGWLVAALTNSHLPRLLNTGSLLALGAGLQLFAQIIRPWKPPFPLFAVTFFFSGLGQAYQDSHANTFVSSVKNAHNWLGFIHAMYGLGCLVSPFVATAIASAGTPSRWTLFYLFPLGLSTINLAVTLVAFKDLLRFKSSSQEGSSDAISRGRNRGATEELRHLVKIGNVWLFCLFFFFHLGVYATAGGWIVQYLTQVRHGALSAVGYVPSGLYGGLFLGRILLTDPTHRFGEYRMLILYTVLCLAVQLVVWLVPNIIPSAVAFSFLGFFLGPFFPAGVSVASKVLPKHVQSASLGLIFVTAQAGGALFPSLIGVIATHAGVKVLQPIIAGLIVIMGITWAFVPKASKNID